MDGGNSVLFRPIMRVVAIYSFDQSVIADVWPVPEDRAQSSEGKGNGKPFPDCERLSLIGRSTSMLRKGLVSAAMAVLALGSIAMADDSAFSGSSQKADSTQVNENSAVNFTQAAIDPVVLADDQSAATPATPAATPAAAPAAERPRRHPRVRRKAPLCGAWIKSA